MPIIDVGATSLGMSGGGFVDPMAQLRDTEAQESDDAIFKSLAAFGTAIYKGVASGKEKRKRVNEDYITQQVTAITNASLSEMNADTDPIDAIESGVTQLGSIRDHDGNSITEDRLKGASNLLNIKGLSRGRSIWHIEKQERDRLKRQEFANSTNLLMNKIANGVMTKEEARIAYSKLILDASLHAGAPDSKQRKTWESMFIITGAGLGHSIDTFEHKAAVVQARININSAGMSALYEIKNMTSKQLIEAGLLDAAEGTVDPEKLRAWASNYFKDEGFDPDNMSVEMKQIFESHSIGLVDNIFSLASMVGQGISSAGNTALFAEDLTLLSNFQKEMLLSPTVGAANKAHQAILDLLDSPRFNPNKLEETQGDPGLGKYNTQGVTQRAKTYGNVMGRIKKDHAKVLARINKTSWQDAGLLFFDAQLSAQIYEIISDTDNFPDGFSPANDGDLPKLKGILDSTSLPFWSKENWNYGGPNPVDLETRTVSTWLKEFNNSRVEKLLGRVVRTAIDFSNAQDKRSQERALAQQLSFTNKTMQQEYEVLRYHGWFSELAEVSAIGIPWGPPAEGESAIHPTPEFLPRPEYSPKQFIDRDLETLNRFPPSKQGPLATSMVNNQHTSIINAFNDSGQMGRDEEAVKERARKIAPEHNLYRGELGKDTIPEDELIEDLMASYIKGFNTLVNENAPRVNEIWEGEGPPISDQTREVISLGLSGVLPEAEEKQAREFLIAGLKGTDLYRNWSTVKRLIAMNPPGSILAKLQDTARKMEARLEAAMEIPLIILKGGNLQGWAKTGTNSQRPLLVKEMLGVLRDSLGVAQLHGLVASDDELAKFGILPDSEGLYNVNEVDEWIRDPELDSEGATKNPDYTEFSTLSSRSAQLVTQIALGGNESSVIDSLNTAFISAIHTENRFGEKEKLSRQNAFDLMTAREMLSGLGQFIDRYSVDFEEDLLGEAAEYIPHIDKIREWRASMGAQPIPAGRDPKDYVLDFARQMIFLVKPTNEHLLLSSGEVLNKIGSESNSADGQIDAIVRWVAGESGIVDANRDINTLRFLLKEEIQRLYTLGGEDPDIFKRMAKVTFDEISSPIQDRNLRGITDLHGTQESILKNLARFVRYHGRAHEAEAPDKTIEHWYWWDTPGLDIEVLGSEASQVEGRAFLTFRYKGEGGVWETIDTGELWERGGSSDIADFVFNVEERENMLFGAEPNEGKAGIKATPGLVPAGGSPSKGQIDLKKETVEPRPLFPLQSGRIVDGDTSFSKFSTMLSSAIDNPNAMVVGRFDEPEDSVATAALLESMDLSGSFPGVMSFLGEGGLNMPTETTQHARLHYDGTGGKDEWPYWAFTRSNFGPPAKRVKAGSLFTNPILQTLHPATESLEHPDMPRQESEFIETPDGLYKKTSSGQRIVSPTYNPMTPDWLPAPPSPTNPSGLSSPEWRSAFMAHMNNIDGLKSHSIHSVGLARDRNVNAAGISLSTTGAAAGVFFGGLGIIPGTAAGGALGIAGGKLDNALMEVFADTGWRFPRETLTRGEVLGAISFMNAYAHAMSQQSHGEATADAATKKAWKRDKQAMLPFWKEARLLLLSLDDKNNWLDKNLWYGE